MNDELGAMRGIAFGCMGSVLIVAAAIVLVLAAKALL